MPVKIAVDTMGGDFGPRIILAGASQFLAATPDDDTSIVFVGPEAKLTSMLADSRGRNRRISIRNADDFIPMDASAREAVRKTSSSLVVAHRMLRDGEVDGVVSAGNTGAVMASAIFNLGRMEGVSRPAIGAIFPTSGDRPCLIMDVGANSDCKAGNLMEFAYMGTIYYSYMVDVAEPRVALLSIGEESSKGNEITVEAHRRLIGNSLNFIGNVEGRDVLAGRADVVICDGFVGNILLKFAESVKGFISGQFKRQVSTNLFSRAGAFLMAPFLKRLKGSFDYSRYGGAPLLGTNGVTIICHGSSNEVAVMNAIRMAREMVVKNVNGHIREKLSTGYSLARLNGEIK
jgi:glycerol-3-phosphate acyltransferase PlsX